MSLPVQEMTEVYAAKLAVFQEIIYTYKKSNDCESIADAVVPTRTQNSNAVAQLVENGDIILTKKKIPQHIITEEAYQATLQGVETITNLHKEGKLVGALR